MTTLASAFRALVLATLSAATLAADTQYMVDYLLPRGGARGSQVTVEFHGRSLENPKEILFYSAGIKAATFEPYSRATDGFKVKFQIAPDCALGEHVLRVRTATALSDAVTFWVGPFPQFPEAETKPGENDSIAKAQPVAMNTTIEGQILPGAEMDRDYYRVEARQGQRISVEVESARLGTLHYGGENDLAVRILDAAGKEIGRNDDSALFVQDPEISLLAPKDGAYFIEIKQQVFYPPRQGWYRMHVGDFSRPTAIFPAGGQAGTTIDARILGDPAGERTAQVQLPSRPGNFDYFAGAEGITAPPSANVLRVSPYSNVLWRPPADCGETCVTPVPALPAALNGIIAKAGEAHTYRVTAKRGEVWRVRVYARSLGAPVDPKIWVKSGDGKRNILQADDSRLADLGLPSSRGSWYIKDQQDPVSLFRVPADGEYLLGIEDAEAAFGPDHVYRIEIESVKPAIYTHITAPDGYQIPRLTGMVIPKGGSWTLDVQLAQGFGNDYKGALEMEAVGLPPGVSMVAPKIAAGVNRIPVQFVAAQDAEPQAALIELRVKPVGSNVTLESGSRQGFALINRPGELPWHFVFLDQFALAVTDPAPFEIELEQPPIPVTQGGDLLLHAKIVRRGDFKGPIEIVTDWLPPGVSKGGVVTIAPDKTEATFQIQANDKAAKGMYQIAMSASTVGGDAFSGVGRVRASSKFIELKVAEPYFSVDLLRSAVEQGKTGEIIAALRISRPFPGKATITLQQLPKGVTMLEAPQVTADDKRVVFRVKAEKDALAGLYKGVKCEVVFTDGGQPVKEHTGSGTLRVDEAKVTEAVR